MGIGAVHTQACYHKRMHACMGRGPKRAPARTLLKDAGIEHRDVQAAPCAEMCSEGGLLRGVVLHVALRCDRLAAALSDVSGLSWPAWLRHNAVTGHRRQGLDRSVSIEVMCCSPRLRQRHG